MTLAVAEASGWYKPDYSKADLLYWGRNKGCDFLEDKCIIEGDGGTPFAISSEFCASPGERGCDFEHLAPSTCAVRRAEVPNPTYWDYFGDNIVSTDAFTDNCPIQHGHQNQVCSLVRESTDHSPEHFGANSACFKSNIRYTDYNIPLQGNCYEYKVTANFSLNKNANSSKINDIFSARKFQ